MLGALLAVGAALAVVSAARAVAPGTFRGSIEPSGSSKVTITYKHQHGTKFRTFSWTLRHVPVHCSDGEAVARYALEGGESVAAHQPGSRSFGLGEVESGPGGHPRYSAFSQGHLISGQRIAGTLNVHGTTVHLQGGGTGDCHSGRLHWVAKR